MAYIPLWLLQLQPASWRGVPFGVDSSEFETGRRVAVHSYPNRDNIWAEDLGLAERRISFSAFLVGDDCYAQRDELAAACEQAGSGTLVHPSLGAKTATLLSAAFGERKQDGRVVEVRFSFVISADRVFPNLYPSFILDTQSALANAAADLDAAVGTDFFAEVGSAIQEGEAVVSSAVSTVQQFASQVITAGQDAARAISSVAGIGALATNTFEFGRFALGNVGSVLNPVLATINRAQNVISLTQSATSALVQASCAAQGAITAAADGVQTLAEAL